MFVSEWQKTWVGKIRWALLVVAIGGPILAWVNYNAAETIKNTMAQGVEATADVSGLTRFTSFRTGSTRYRLETSWVGPTGQRHEEDISVTRTYANSIKADDGFTITVDQVRIKYLPDSTEPHAVLVDDASRMNAEEMQTALLWLGGGGVGLIGSIAFLLFGRKKPRPAHSV